jgi:hypothetical protein
MRRMPLAACILQLPCTSLRYGPEAILQSKPQDFAADIPSGRRQSDRNALRCYEAPARQGSNCPVRLNPF